MWMMCLHSDAGIFIHSSVKIAEIKIIRVVFYVSSLLGILTALYILRGIYIIYISDSLT